MNRRRAIGAELVGRGVHFRVWAPAHERVSVVIGAEEFPLERESDGYFSGVVNDAKAGTLYRFRLDDDTYPDPASRYQPTGPHGPSQVVDPSAYRWRDDDWRGVDPKRVVLYEMHVGTFTRLGTYAAATEHLAELASIGINTLELMPVNEFPGDFGWGYDGVDLFAPTRLYGDPDDFRRFVDAAHMHGIAIILDVVYNHMGPDGCFLSQFTPRYFTKKYENEWGEPMNFDDEDAHGVRTFFVENAAYWIDEFHLDGLRIDATQSMFDETEPHILREISDAVRAASNGRATLLVAENEPQHTKLLREYGLDALWNDDWHHAARVALTGNTEAYYTDYRGTAQELVSMATSGFLYQGQWYRWQKKRRGTPSHDVAPEKLVCYLENHDQVANSPKGARLRAMTSPGRLRAMTTLLLLQPQTPMLFQGQEFGSTAPFVYFAHHNDELAKKVSKGRKEFLGQFPSIKPELVPEPNERATFEMCKLDREQRDEELVELHRTLLRLRRSMPFDATMRGAVLADGCFALRWLAGGDDDRLLIVNLGAAIELAPVSEPLLALPAGFASWEVVFASGGTIETDEAWKVPGEAAVLLKASPR